MDKISKLGLFITIILVLGESSLQNGFSRTLQIISKSSNRSLIGKISSSKNPNQSDSDSTIITDEEPIFYFIERENYFPRIIRSSEYRAIKLELLNFRRQSGKISVNNTTHLPSYNFRFIVDNAYASFRRDTLFFDYPQIEADRILVAAIYEGYEAVVKSIKISKYGPNYEGIFSITPEDLIELPSLEPQNIFIGNTKKFVSKPRSITTYISVSSDSIQPVFPDIIIKTNELAKVHSFDFFRNFPADSNGYSLIPKIKDNMSITIRKAEHLPRQNHLLEDVTYDSVSLIPHWSENFRWRGTAGVELWGSCYLHDKETKLYSDSTIVLPLPSLQSNILWKRFMFDLYFRGVPFYVMQQRYFELRGFLAYPLIINRLWSFKDLHLFAGVKFNYLNYRSKSPDSGTPDLNPGSLAFRLQPSFYFSEDILIELGAEARVVPWRDKKHYNIPRSLFEVKVTKYKNGKIWGGHIQFVPKFQYKLLNGNNAENIRNFSIQAFYGIQLD